MFTVTFKKCIHFDLNHVWNFNLFKTLLQLLPDQPGNQSDPKLCSKLKVKENDEEEWVLLVGGIHSGRFCSRWKSRASFQQGRSTDSAGMRKRSEEFVNCPMSMIPSIQSFIFLGGTCRRKCSMRSSRATYRANIGTTFDVASFLQHAFALANCF